MDTVPPHLYPLSLHDALPISAHVEGAPRRTGALAAVGLELELDALRLTIRAAHDADVSGDLDVDLEHLASALHSVRSEEHTSELQSLRHLVCRLLLEKKNN